MNIKRIWLVLPTVVLPYLALATVALVMMSTDIPLFEQIMEKVFNNNALYVVAVFLGFWCIAYILDIVCLFFALKGNWDPLSMAKSIMIIKLIQIPAFVAIFILGALFLVTIFTFAITFVFWIMDISILIQTGILIAASVINSVKKGDFTYTAVWWVIPLQFIFCVDVVATVVYYIILRKKRKLAEGRVAVEA